MDIPFEGTTIQPIGGLYLLGLGQPGAALTVMGRETLSVDDELKAGLGVACGPWRILIF